MIVSSFLLAHDNGAFFRTDASLGRVADNQRRAAGVPLLAKRRPGKLLSLCQAAVELCSGLCDCGRLLALSLRVEASIRSGGAYTRQGR